MRITLKTILVLILTGVLTFSLFGCKDKTSSTSTSAEVAEEEVLGKLMVSITDKDKKSPISDAKIYIVGIENIYNTDASGRSPEISIKINKDMYKKYGGDLWQKAPSGSIALLVSKEGYKDYLVFNKAIYPGYAANTLKIQLSKTDKNSKSKFDVVVNNPHDVWVEELVAYCKTIQENKEGIGDCTASITINDSKSKAIEGATVVVPELGLKGITDKSGKISLKLNSDKDVYDIYPVKKDYMEYTVVAMKDGYVSGILFNAKVYKDKENNINIALTSAKAEDKASFEVVNQAPDDTWIKLLIDNYVKDI
ncbi:hypothetical protein OXPF_21520 [Oxobacter pfennigii]|uniref:Uncharacterized protein n=1 Tax=Oxobacter pfennigii TaxID=36849 RepID=A0A0P8YWA4_9CLOT|nr:hypothetical protein [Oxobacter pfennigii]KPU43987.1 hypothetical protein OXPF_21520 [Oxobacter pfennigii]